jgi:sigma-B regulation protein RsbU (phosphoserine phosphatase)
MPLRFNLYNTTDPEQLLHLKRKEADALLEVVRSLDVSLPTDELIFLVVNTIRLQLGVYKLMFIATDPDYGSKEVHVNYGFDRPSPQHMEHLDTIQATKSIQHTPGDPLKQLGVEYVVPLGRNDVMNAWFLISDFAESDEERKNDIIFIETVGNILNISLQNIRLFEEKLARERLQRELELAGNIQSQALPKNFNIMAELDIYAHSLAHSSVGGDFYNLLKLNDHELVIFMADAAGKGIAAALLITNIQANLNALLKTGATYEQIIHQLHHVIGRLTHYEQFVTLFLGRINLWHGEIEYLNAGHNPPLLVQNGEVQELGEGCIPLGIMEVRDFQIGREQFQAGDALFLYTDGLIEQTDPQDHLFGDERVRAIVTEQSSCQANRLVDHMLSEIARFSDGVPFQDDISLMAVRYRDAVEPRHAQPEHSPQ